MALPSLTEIRGQLERGLRLVDVLERLVEALGGDDAPRKTKRRVKPEMGGGYDLRR